MKKIAIFSFLVLLTFALMPITAQNDDCDAESIAARVDEAYDSYAGNRDLEDANTALADVESLQETLADITVECSDALAIGSSSGTDGGSGTLIDPFTFNQFADSGDGIFVRVTGLIRPADRTIRNENMFNDRPEDGEEWVIVFVDVRCAESRTETCELNNYNFDLSGDNGIIYEGSFVVYDDILDINVRPGREGSGGLPFLIEDDDTNLALIFYPESRFFSDGETYYSAEPSAEDGITIISTSGINVRGGPSTGFGVVDSLQSGDQVIAFGRNEDGTWVQIQSGWVFAELVDVSGDVMELPITSE